MKLKMIINKNDDANRMILVCAIGLLEAIENHLVTLKDSQKYLFNSASVEILEKEEIDQKVIGIIKLACELVDAEFIEPDSLATNITDLKSKAKECVEGLEYNPDFNSNMKWLHRF